MYRKELLPGLLPIYRDANYSNMIIIICRISFHNDALPTIIQSGI